MNHIGTAEYNDDIEIPFSTLFPVSYSGPAHTFNFIRDEEHHIDELNSKSRPVLRSLKVHFNG